MTVSTIPATHSFLDALATGLLRADPLDLARTTILLPSRRACLALRETFIEVSNGRPLLLPSMRPVGEPDETMLGIDPQTALRLPPAIAPLARRLALSKLVLARDPEMPHEQAIRLAGELETVLDELQAEEVGLDGLDQLVPAEFAEHWQDTLRFLSILREAWPAHLRDRNLLDAAVRRNRLVDAQAAAWRADPPAHRIIAAGITGSIPAIARLLATVAKLRQGEVILQGLDLDLDEASWNALPPTHPQAQFRQLLDVMGIGRQEIAIRADPGLSLDPAPSRQRLWREVMRPASTIANWLDNPPPRDAFDGIELVRATDPRQEALAITLRLRELLEHPDKRAVLVTGNRNLARQVAAELRRFAIELDDSAGIPLDQSPPGSLLTLSAHLLVSGTPPETLSMLKHPLVRGEDSRAAFLRFVRELERHVLRRYRTGAGLKAILQRLTTLAAAGDGGEAGEGDDAGEGEGGGADLASITERMAWLVEQARPFDTLRQKGEAPLGELLRAHLGFLHELTGDAGIEPAGELYAREAGMALRSFIEELGDAQDYLSDVPTQAWPAILAVLMASVPVRSGGRGHPRIAILGQFESRLMQADLVILGGLAEGTWPRDVESGPWLNRAMRKHLGLPPVDREIGAAALDFVAAASAPRVVLTCAMKDETGTPVTPSRWVTRLVALLRAAANEGALDPDPSWALWAQALDAPEGPIRPVRRPAPRPPVACRPRSFSASDIETLIRDPYTVYARRILGLMPLDPIEAEIGAADRGSLIHKALERFVRTYPSSLPQDPLATLAAIGRELFLPEAEAPEVFAIWWPRFLRVAEWFIECEQERRARNSHVLSELRGRLDLRTGAGPFDIRARADRIEVGHDNRLVIVDYKTGTPPAAKMVALGLAPQLPIEVLIAAEGGFEQLGDASGVEAAHYWELKGGAVKGQIVDRGRTVGWGRLAEDAREGLIRLVTHFENPDTPYTAVPRPDIATVKGDYDHLSRRGEWFGSEGAAE